MNALAVGNRAVVPPPMSGPDALADLRARLRGPDPAAALRAAYAPLPRSALSELGSTGGAAATAGPVTGTPGIRIGGVTATDAAPGSVPA
jgi:hypothetical protein